MILIHTHTDEQIDRQIELMQEIIEDKTYERNVVNERQRQRQHIF